MSVLIYAENWDGKFKKLTFELASYGARIAEMLGTKLIAVSIGNVEESELKQLGRFGVEKVIAADNKRLKQFDSQAYSGLIAQLAQKEGAKVIILASNNAGKSIAPRLSVRLKAALGSGVNKLPLSTDPFVVSKKVFSGNAFAQLLLDTPVKIITLLQNSFDLGEKPVDITVENLQTDLGGLEVKTEVIEIRKQEGNILLTDAEIVVSGGRGMKSPDNWQPIVELAELLNAATACSRPVSDEGWRPHEEHTGQTGKIIAPNLYFAVGISGATQHLAGVSSSKYIVAINNDKSAPIFEAAQYGIVGDAQKVLPQIIEAVKELRNK
ncbi:MAG: electron transfer flavoprotein subunit alpha/FixB family protein [Bacteroidales bacterium]|jgi:electron transfer flavoprotein alpha subunit|nr:electron transfer flavoprotein subunit alpha/FixB family protein [Bacteroidales bacterium]NLM93640.1 electron transfer flavoprotein subunit alpha/FixB family protein [Bacteroidales bacterium]